MSLWVYNGKYKAEEPLLAASRSASFNSLNKYIHLSTFAKQGCVGLLQSLPSPARITSRMHSTAYKKG